MTYYEYGSGFNIISKEGRYVIRNLKGNDKKFNSATAYVITDAISEINPRYKVDKANSTGRDYYTNIYVLLEDKNTLQSVLKDV